MRWLITWITQGGLSQGQFIIGVVYYRGGLSTIGLGVIPHRVVYHSGGVSLVICDGASLICDGLT